MGLLLHQALSTLAENTQLMLITYPAASLTHSSPASDNPGISSNFDSGVSEVSKTCSYLLPFSSHNPMSVGIKNMLLGLKVSSLTGFPS